MAFKAKHDSDSPNCLAWLGDIEIPQFSQVIVPGNEPRWYRTFTDLELRLLIRNTTGADHPNAMRDHMLATCAALACAMHARTDLNGFDLERQWLAVQGDSARHYQYVQGASKPAKKADLWEPSALHHHHKLDPNAVQALQQAARSAAPVAPAGVGSPSSVPATRTAAPKGPPRGGLREEVWKAMDEIWSSAGNPVLLSHVLPLRKRCMDELEKQGCKRTSVSSELGNWQKARLAQAQ